MLCHLPHVPSCRPINDTVKPIDADGPYEVLDVETIGECTLLSSMQVLLLLLHCGSQLVCQGLLENMAVYCQGRSRFCLSS